ncbi:type II secretion system F family protein [Thermomonas sp.]|uniref:type II secretion system F family protein n=1 Tax=Thermomonas sp. TaxID=1971895 RepID=UPI00262C59F8|nr:type II secretion system F family protein [Thermomonas sp.]
MSAARRAAVAKSRGRAEARQTNQAQEFVWVGRDKRGKEMKGEQLSRSANLLRAELRKQGITPTSVKAKPKPLFGGSGKKISARDIAIFSRQIATMMKSGVPIVQALEIIAQGNKNPNMKKMVNSLRNDIEGGASIYEAMSQFPVQFDDLYRNLVRAGEASGVLETVLETIANYKENIESIKGKVKKALFYPAAVIAVAIIISAVLMIFVVPMFKEAFSSFGADLPAFTNLVFGISDYVVKYFWLIGIVLFAAAAGFIYVYKRSDNLRQAVDRTMLKIPVIGELLHKSAIARFARTLAVTFKAGVPLVEALDSVAGATGSRVYEVAVRKMQEDVAVGYPVNVAMKQVGLFPHMVVQMTAIGEEAGALDTMLFKIAEFYEEEVNNTVDSLSSLIEPMVMVIIGGLVGSIIVAMYLPIFKLAATVM